MSISRPLVRLTIMPGRFFGTNGASKDGQGNRGTDHQCRRLSRGLNGSIDFFINANWINEADTEQLRMLADVAAIVLGAKTYRMFADYWPSANSAVEPVSARINELPKFVVASTLESAPSGVNDSAEILRGNAVAAVRGLRNRFTGNLIVWGSLSLSDELLRAGEVDVLRLRVIPVLLGDGRSFVPSDLGLRRLSLANAQSFTRSLIVLEYHLVASTEGTFTF